MILQKRIKSLHYRTWFIFLVIGVIIVGFYGRYLPLPPEIGMYGEVYSVPDESVVFLSDETYLTEDQERVSEQTIFDEVFRMIDHAEHFILVDMFLWNSFQGAKPETHRALSEELAGALIDKKIAQPDTTIVVVSDPINTMYDGLNSPEFDRMRANGIPVILTDLAELRDSNPTYSSFWRTFLQWPDQLHTLVLGKPYTFRWFPNVMGANSEKVTLRAYLRLLNFKANHRKLIVADERIGDELRMVTLVTSANPHNGSSAHSNVALRVSDGVWRDIVKSEQAIATFSDYGTLPLPDLDTVTDKEGAVFVAVRTELAIRDQVLEMLDSASEGDQVDLAMFYFSEKKIIEALIDASKRGAEVRVILDPNKDAFGMEKNGVPNRQVAGKLVRDSDDAIEVRWCSTHGEQCHTKLLLLTRDDEYSFMLGSANYTRRNLNNLNLETNIWVTSSEPSTAYTDASEYFERMWTNDEGRTYTVDYEVYKDDSRFKRFLAWFMERTGLSTF